MCWIVPIFVLVMVQIWSFIKFATLPSFSHHGLATGYVIIADKGKYRFRKHLPWLFYQWTSSSYNTLDDAVVAAKKHGEKRDSCIVSPKGTK